MIVLALGACVHVCGSEAAARRRLYRMCCTCSLCRRVHQCPCKPVACACWALCSGLVMLQPAGLHGRCCAQRPGQQGQHGVVWRGPRQGLPASQVACFEEVAEGCNFSAFFKTSHLAGRSLAARGACCLVTCFLQLEQASACALRPPQPPKWRALKNALTPAVQRVFHNEPLGRQGRFGACTGAATHMTLRARIHAAASRMHPPACPAAALPCPASHTARAPCACAYGTHPTRRAM